jgi:intraflagellar transport protein 46
MDKSTMGGKGSPGAKGTKPEAKKGGGEAKGVGKAMSSGSEQTKSQSILNRPFDEALEFSHSGSDESVDTRSSEKKAKRSETQAKGTESKSAPTSSSQLGSSAIGGGGGSQQPKLQPQPASSTSAAPAKSGSASHRQEDDDDDSGDGDSGDQGEESYENIEGAYNPKDFESLNVTAEVRDLFQYIERYKPQEVELETTLKCFIPEYIPAIGEMDAFIKVPRPDGANDDLGLKFLDEPSATQSDPTVLELQLRAMSKKLQYGDVVVRSIDNAPKNPQAIEKWIQSINDLHRSKPPPQVHYRRNMPDVDQLLDVWPEEFEAALEHLQLPSPDLELSLPEYTRVLCSILDIPVYDNPIESLHVMFSLYMDFRNNPQFQRMGGGPDTMDSSGAEVMQVVQGK